MAEILTPRCPLCDRLPGMVFGVQAFCANEVCTILSWTPTLSLDDNLMDAGVVRFPAADDPEPTD
jgi:hypothetical protein